MSRPVPLMRALLALSALAVLVALAAPASASTAPVSCMGCDVIIALCEKTIHTQCVESMGPQCAVSLCQDIDRVCARWGFHCVA